MGMGEQACPSRDPGILKTASIATSHIASPPSFNPGSIPTATHVTNLDLDVTENCNLGYTYCFKGEKTTSNMTLETAKESVNWLLQAAGPADSVNINFMGGEPTMRWPLIRELVPWARRRGRVLGKVVTFSMTSNLTLWTDEIREFVDRYGFGVLMSIDGCPEVQESQRAAKNGRTMIETIERWAKSMLLTRPRSTARATVTPAFVTWLPQSMRYLHDLGFREVAVSPCDYADWTATHFEELETALEAIVDYVCERRLKGEDFNLTVFKYLVAKLVHPRRTGHDDGECKHVVSQPCGAGKGMMMIDHAGDIWPCHRFDGADEGAEAEGQLRLGNIFTGTFEHERQRAFTDFDHAIRHKASCSSCPVNPVCAGYCPAANISDTGSLYTPHDAYCRWSQTAYAAAENLYDRLAETPEQLDRFIENAKGTSSDGTR